MSTEESILPIMPWFPVRPCTLSVEGISKPVDIRVLSFIFNIRVPFRDVFAPSRSTVPLLAVRAPLGVAPMPRPRGFLVLAGAEVIDHIGVHISYPAGHSFVPREIAQVVEFAPVGPVRPMRRRGKTVSDVYIRPLTREEVLDPSGPEIRPFALLFLVARPYPRQPGVLVPFTSNGPDCIRHGKKFELPVHEDGEMCSGTITR